MVTGYFQFYVTCNPPITSHIYIENVSSATGRTRGAVVIVSNYYNYYLTSGAVSKPTSENCSSATGRTRGAVIIVSNYWGEPERAPLRRDS